MPVSNKKQEFEQQKRIKLFDDFRVCASRFDFARGAGLEQSRCKQSIFSLSMFGILVERLNSSVFTCCKSAHKVLGPSAKKFLRLLRCGFQDDEVLGSNTKYQG